MKKLMLLCVIVLSVTIATFAATYTVDNTPNSAADYSTIPSAIAAASNGDTLLVYGSAYGYGNVSVNKQLTIIGSAGFDPQVSNESTPTLGTVDIPTGGSGTVMSGFYMNSLYGTGTVDNVGIYNNRFSGSYGVYFYLATSSNWIIEGNVFQSSGQNSFIESYQNNSTLNNILIKNNYFESGLYYYYFAQYNNSAFTYRNNLFVIRSGSGYNFFNACSNVLFENNIFWVTTAANTDIIGQQCTGCVFNNNIIYNSGGGIMTDINSIGNGVTGNNNFINQDPQFMNFTESDNYTIVEDYRLANASPGKNAATDGGDIGLFGGNYTWENRKYPKAFPHQEIFNVINSSVPQGTPVNVNLKARKAAN